MRLALVTSLLAIALAPGTAEAAKPLALKARTLGTFPNLAQVWDGRLVLEPVRDRAVVTDDRTGMRYSQALSPGCSVVDLRLPEALLACPADVSGDWRPVVLDLRDGRYTEMPGDRYYADTSFTELGSSWLGGWYTNHTAKGAQEATYLNRRTGERRKIYSGGPRDLDSPTLVPRRLPSCERRLVLSRTRRGRYLLRLYRCGKRPKLISRCHDFCWNRALTRRYAIWSGNRTVTVHALRSGRRFKLQLRFRPESFIYVAATDRRLRISVPLRGNRYRVLELRLP